jgi:hypothetical protein
MHSSLVSPRSILSSSLKARREACRLCTGRSDVGVLPRRERLPEHRCWGSKYMLNGVICKGRKQMRVLNLNKVTNAVRACVKIWRKRVIGVKSDGV